MKKSKKIIIAFCAVIVLFGLYNLIWYLVVQNKYDKYADGMEENRPGISYVLNNNDGFTYNVKYPDYLSFTGNLGAQTEDGTYSLIIWPGIIEKTEYCIILPDEQGVFYHIMIDENISPLTDDPYEIQLVEKNKTKIEELFKLARKKWKIE